MQERRCSRSVYVRWCAREDEFNVLLHENYIEDVPAAYRESTGQVLHCLLLCQSLCQYVWARWMKDHSVLLLTAEHIKEISGTKFICVAKYPDNRKNLNNYTWFPKPNYFKVIIKVVCRNLIYIYIYQFVLIE